MTLAWDAPRTEGYRRVRSDDLYHTARWTKLARSWKECHPLCEECKKRGVIKEAEVVDHIIPFPVCRDFFDTSNLQSLCEQCNIAKGNRDKKLIAEWKRKKKVRCPRCRKIFFYLTEDVKIFPVRTTLRPGSLTVDRSLVRCPYCQSWVRAPKRNDIEQKPDIETR